MNKQHEEGKKELVATIASELDSETLKSISKPKEFEEKEIFTRLDTYLAEDTTITDKRIIKSYGKRVDELRKRGKDGKRITEKELAQVCEVTVQTISDIIKGKNKSVNIKYCNKLAEYFKCSSYYILGLTDSKNGVLIDGKAYRLPIFFFDGQETISITQAGQWARKDPELFAILDSLFQIEEEKRAIIREAIKLML